MYLGRVGGLTMAILLSACGASSQGNASASSSEGVATQQAEQSNSPNATPVMSESTMEATNMKGSPAAPSMEPGLRDSYIKCAEATNGSTWEMQSCVEEEFEYQDARLNAAYRKLQSQLPEAQKKSLTQDERKWMSDRDESCEWHPEEEGQAQRIEANICSLKQTSDRANQLEKMLADLDNQSK